MINHRRTTEIKVELLESSVKNLSDCYPLARKSMEKAMLSSRRKSKKETGVTVPTDE